jgi:Flp pilus assembly protein TadB
VKADRLRLYLIAALALAAILSVAGKKAGAAWVGQLSVGVFLVSVALYFTWRRAALRERRGRVFDREAKTDETRTRADQ